MGESYRERYRGHDRDSGADWDVENRRGSWRHGGEPSTEGGGYGAGHSHFGVPRERPEERRAGPRRVLPMEAPPYDRFAREEWRHAFGGAPGGMGEVGRDEGYPVAYGGEDYRYSPEHGFRDQRPFYGSGPRGPHAGKGPRGWRRSDDRVHDDVCAMLADHPEIDASDVEVEVQSGEVTLAGRVDGRRQKRLAEDIALGVAGVIDVHNRLRVRREGAAAPADEPAGVRARDDRNAHGASRS